MHKRDTSYLHFLASHDHTPAPFFEPEPLESVTGFEVLCLALKSQVILGMSYLAFPIMLISDDFRDAVDYSLSQIADELDIMQKRIDRMDYD
jgi:hypothetical protein